MEGDIESVQVTVVVLVQEPPHLRLVGGPCRMASPGASPLLRIPKAHKSYTRPKGGTSWVLYEVYSPPLGGGFLDAQTLRQHEVKKTGKRALGMFRGWYYTGGLLSCPKSHVQYYCVRTTQHMLVHRYNTTLRTCQGFFSLSHCAP